MADPKRKAVRMWAVYFGRRLLAVYLKRMDARQYARWLAGARIEAGTFLVAPKKRSKKR